MLTAEVYLQAQARGGPGGVQASFDFRGAKKDVAGRMLTITLTNDLDAGRCTYDAAVSPVREHTKPTHRSSLRLIPGSVDECDGRMTIAISPGEPGSAGHGR